MKEISKKGFIRLRVYANLAAKMPSLNPILGQARVNIRDFCLQFNALSSAKYNDDVLLSVNIFRRLGLLDSIIIRGPTLPFLLFQAIGENCLVDTYNINRYYSTLNVIVFYPELLYEIVYLRMLLINESIFAIVDGLFGYFQTCMRRIIIHIF